MLVFIFVGIAPNMMLAKVCSDMNKPNGQYIIPSTVEDVMSFIRKLPIRKVIIQETTYFTDQHSLLCEMIKMTTCSQNLTVKDQFSTHHTKIKNEQYLVFSNKRKFCSLILNNLFINI